MKLLTEVIAWLRDPSVSMEARGNPFLVANMLCKVELPQPEAPAPFAFETDGKYERLDGYTSRLRVPGGWVLRTLWEHPNTIFIADEAHTWIIAKPGFDLDTKTFSENHTFDLDTKTFLEK